jgi:hypothetical protein
MLYHPNSPYYRQFLTASAKAKAKKVEQLIQAQVSKSMPSVNPGSVGV